tara:strand:- start:683 stop:991 length:309 start_codon:yes stop_codon:yes gene_type:complete
MDRALFSLGRLLSRKLALPGSDSKAKKRIAGFWGRFSEELRVRKESEKRRASSVCEIFKKSAKRFSSFFLGNPNQAGRKITGYADIENSDGLLRNAVFPNCF